MPVDPNLQPLLDVINGMDGGDLSELSVSEARELLRMMAAVDGEPDAVAELSDRTIPGPAGPIPVRVYRPESDAAALPILVWYHGGGWVIGDLETADWTARRLANRVGAVVVSVDYRLAPEHQFPAAVEDCWAALEWASTSGAEVGGDPGRLAVGGDSAGGNLAAVMAIAARDRGLTGLRYQLLVYPATDLTMSHPSIDENGEGYLLTKKAMVWFTDHYLGADGDPKDVQASPIYTADLSGLAPATVLTAGFDPLRDEGDEYAALLANAGGAVQHRSYETMIHGFFSMGATVPVGDDALAAAAADLRAALS